MIGPLTVVIGCLARSVRDAGPLVRRVLGLRQPRPLLAATDRRLGARPRLVRRRLRGKRVVIAPTLGSAVVRPEVEALVRSVGEDLARWAGLEVVDVPVSLPGLGVEWALANLATLQAELGDLWPGCKDDITTEIAFGLEFATHADEPRHRGQG